MVAYIKPKIKPQIVALLDSNHIAPALKKQFQIFVIYIVCVYILISNNAFHVILHFSVVLVLQYWSIS